MTRSTKGQRRHAAGTVIAFCLALVAALGPADADRVGDKVDEYPDDPAMCGGSFNGYGAWCEFVPAGTPITVEMTYTTGHPDQRVEVHAEISVLVPETVWGVRILECEETGTGSSECSTTLIPAPAAVPLGEEAAVFTCMAHVHMLPPSPAGSGTFICSGGR